MDNIKKMRQVFVDNQGLDAVLITSKPNKFFLGGLYSSRGYVLLQKSIPTPLYFVDYRSVEELQNSITEGEIIELRKDDHPQKILANYLNDYKIKNVGLESDDVTVKTFSKLKKLTSDIDWQAVRVDQYRWVKNASEIFKITKACEIASQAYINILQLIKVGMTEAEVANHLVFEMKRLGAEKESFDTIVASGVRGALPHGKASDKQLKHGDFVTIDFGAKYQGYCSDMTRTFVMGEVKNTQMHEIYISVQRAQEKVMSEAKAGIKCADMDRLARKSISDDGYGEYFVHHLGHGVGIECHESPRFSLDTDVELAANMIMTNEPGIYVPGLGGVRIEDTILITEDGCQQLTTAPKELIVI